MRLSKIQQFLQLEAISGILLMLFAILALILSNSPWGPSYEMILQKKLAVHFFQYELSGSVLFWINEGLMTIFFLLVGLELKREFIEGHLSNIKDIFLPAVAAFGGMLVPALIYISLNLGHPLSIKGWAVPVATDIAFALGALSLFGNKVPIGLKLFLMALAIFDDLGAILIIALSHSHDLSIFSLLGSGLCLCALISLNRLKVNRLWPYVIFGILLWVCVLKSGIHATVAGVLFALLVPLNRKSRKKSPLHRLEDYLHPWVAYGVLPLFALANAGLSFHGLNSNILMSSIVLGTTGGLFLGKQIGVFSFTWAMVRLKWASLPPHVSWGMLYGVALFCGIGFTMSLFLGTLAFQNEAARYLIEVRLGVLLGSLMSALMGVFILHKAFKKNN